MFVVDHLVYNFEAGRMVSRLEPRREKPVQRGLGGLARTTCARFGKGSFETPLQRSEQQTPILADQGLDRRQRSLLWKISRMFICVSPSECLPKFASKINQHTVF